MSSTSSPFSPPTRYVTTTNPDTGLSSIWLDGKLPMNPIRPGTTSLAGNVWIQKDQFADNLNDIDGGTLVKAGTVEPNGSVVQIVDIPPGNSSPLHFTTSIDYMFVVKGVITMELTDGSFTDIEEGELVVQRGTAHAWHNKSSDFVRFLAVLLPAKPILTAAGDEPKGLHLP